MFLTTRVVLALTVVAGALGIGAAPAQAVEQHVKYYTVTSSYRGQKENLTEIAERFLGDGGRSAAIYNLNAGRPQPDGSSLADGAKLNAGWILVLPWDAVGGGVQYGVLPDKSQSTSVKPPTPRPSPSATSTPKPTISAKPVRSSTPPSPGGGKCAVASAASSTSNWAGLRLAADKAWPQSKGKGQLVGIVDSGVDGSLPQLAGHVAVGSDLVTGKGRGDTDCLGTGTAMAGLIVAQGSTGGVSGVAPGATVMPVRIAGTSAKVQTQNAASAITAAVEGGSTVVALGSYVDTSQKLVADAVAAAVRKDVLVVLGASLASKAVNPKAMIGEGTLRVGGIGVDDQRVAAYRKGGVDVVAPGVNVSSLGISGTGTWTGSGTQYAVALVAGTAALVRSAYPSLTAEQVAHRIEATADKMTDAAVPDGSFGYGRVNPAESVTKVLAEEATAADEEATHTALVAPGGGRNALLVIVTLAALAAAILLAFRIRRLLRDDPVGDRAPGEGEQASPEPPHDDIPPPAAAVRPPSVKLSRARPTQRITPGVRPPDELADTPAVSSADVTVAPPHEPAEPDLADLKSSVGAKSARARD